VAGFDWYQATVRGSVDDVLAGCLTLGEGAFLSHSRGVHGFATTTTIKGDDGTLGAVWHGGTHALPHVVFTGEGAQAGAELIRASFPDHHVTRLDSREDFGGEGVFDRLQPVLMGVAEARRIKVGTAGDHLLTMEGRTVYLGSTKSPVRLRMYDKAAELRAKFAASPDKLATIPAHLTRLEAQVRPETREAKAQAATLDPLAVFGCSAWLRDVWRGVVGLEVDPVQVTKPYRQSDHERAKAYMLAQYGGVLRAMFEDSGSWECVGLQLGHDLAERNAGKR
jgi:Replication initiation factor